MYRNSLTHFSGNSKWRIAKSLSEVCKAVTFGHRWADVNFT